VPGLLVGELQQKAQNEFDMHRVSEECEKIGNKSFPFARGGFFDKLADTYKSIHATNENVINRKRTQREADFVYDTLGRSLMIIERECFNAPEKNQTCREYFLHALKELVLERMKNIEGGITIYYVFMFQEFYNTFRILLDKEFWLNAPEACWMTSEQQAVGLADGMEKHYENVQNSGGPPRGL
jgi:hypothetical protein